ncbi:MAG: N-acetylglucosamine-6-phosphate deacetylase [Bacteroidota bacterium]
MKILKVFNGKVITPSGIISNGTVIIKGDKIDGVYETNIELTDAIEIDAKGQYISPGFIDIHLHGGGGHDFMDNTLKAFENIAIVHAKFGTTSMVPTTLTSTKEHLIKTLEAFQKASEKEIAGANFLGVHIEGPYFSMDQRGAQDPKYIRLPEPNEYSEILERFPFITRWSAAPELEGALLFGQILTEKKIIASIAHTEALYDDVVKARKAGYNLMTHLYSGMLGVTRINGWRHGGAVESAFLFDDMDVEIIADGKHLPAELLQLIYKIKGSDRIALITDAMRAAGTKADKSILGNLKEGIEVIIEDGVAKLSDRTAFAGSIATTNQLVVNMIEKGNVSLEEAVKMASQTPARIMKVADKKGKIAKGYDADIVIFDKNINISKTIIGGRLVYQNTIS